MQIITRNNNYDDRNETSNGRLSMNDGNLQSITELGLLLTCSNRYDSGFLNADGTYGAWFTASESLANGATETKPSMGDMKTHLENQFNQRISPYANLAQGGAMRNKIAAKNDPVTNTEIIYEPQKYLTDPRDLKPNLPRDLNIFEQVTIIKPADGKTLIPGFD